MNPEAFRTLAERIAGRFWKSRLGPKIGKSRDQVWEFATGKRGVP